MFNRFLSSLSVILLILCSIAPSIANTASVWKSEHNLFQISYTPDLSPLPINQIHHWILHIETINGANIEGAQVTFTGGMPEHNHGMPTSPQVTKELGNGDYLLEGVRFHMMGYWELVVTINSGDIVDTVIISLEL